jgi:hypothetical protein
LLLATNYLSRKKYLRYKEKGVNIFLFNEIDFSTDEYIDDTFFNCNSEKVPSTWFTWDENDKLLQSFKIKYPQFFNWNGYDMTLVFQKMLFWTNYKTGFLWYCKNKFYPDVKVCHIDEFHPYSVVKSGIRYFRARMAKQNIVPVKNEIRAQDKSYAIHLKDDFELGLYDHFIKEAAKTSAYRLFYEKKLSNETIENLGLKKDDITYLHTLKPIFNFPAIDLKKVKGTEWYILSAFFRHWEVINKWMYKSEQMAFSGIRHIVVNEAENGIYGACLGEVMKKNGVKVYNTMNGLKAGQAQDAHINFTKWFVWDEQMKRMLMEKCGLEEARLVVCGHLMEDFAIDYVNQDSLGIDKNLLKGKKVISVFSIKSKREAKLYSLSYLYELVKKDPSLFLIVRPHPSEKTEDFILPDFESDRIHWVQYEQKNSKTTLYDQISISDVCVVFGSTVALECKWFDKSCLTLEPRKTSLLYFVDGHDTVHVNNVSDFKVELNNLLYREKEMKISQPLQKVATRMVEYMHSAK